jgi:hypothetical protein
VKRRDRIAVGIVAAIVALGGFWFLALSPKRDDASKLSDQVDSQRAALASARSQIAAYTAAKADYPQNYATVVRLGKAVPADDGVPSLLYALSATSHRSHVAFRSFKLGGGSGAAASSGASGSDAAKLPPGAAVGEAGFPTMPFSFVFDGSFFRLGDFIQRLENYVRVDGEKVRVGGRQLRVSGFTLNGGSGSTGGEVQASITATGFLTPADEGVLAGATPQAPAGVPGSSSGSVAATETTAASTGGGR